jgi:hypothetical protein
MAVLPTGIGPVTGYNIERSLRFNSADSAYLNRTLTTPTDGKKWTWSGWVKRTTLGTTLNLFTANSATGIFRFTSTDTLLSGWTGAANLETTQVFRDASAWYHIMLVVDTTQATASNRVKYYVNGSQITAFSSTDYPTQNSATTINSAVAHNIGAYQSSSQYANCYMTEIYFIDGQALTPSDFGETDSATGVWKPKAYSGTYGTNGFFLKFADNSGTTSTTLGKDSSGNGNNWTPNNFSVTAGSGNDSLVDSPTAYGTDTGVGGEVRGNYCTLNPLLFRYSAGAGTLTNGNLQATGSSTYFFSTFQMPATGKWYFEGVPTAGSSTPGIGLGDLAVASTVLTNQVQYLDNGSKTVNGSNTSYGASYTTNDVIGVAVDCDAGTITFYKNNTSQGAITTTVRNQFVYLQTGGSWTWVMNFGQRAFAYTAPSGFKALCTTNLPTPTIGATSTTQAEDYFEPILYTGTGANQSIGGLDFAPDLVWIKCRSNAEVNQLYDTIRGATKMLSSDLTQAEGTYSTNLTAFTSNGFSVGTDPGVNGSGRTYVAWQWNAGGSTVTNTSGTITSTVRANTTSGFSVVTFTSVTSTANTIGHGLGVAPEMVIMKTRGSSAAFTGWAVYHKSTTAGGYLVLNTTAAYAANTATWNNTAPTSTVFSMGTGWGTSDNFVAYCFAPIAGYSAFGSYTGNGSSDGVFVYTGFRPRFILFKESSASGNDWYIFDSVRSTYNVATNRLFPNSSAAEATNFNTLDILSNGWKLRDSNSAWNGSGATYIYMALAESPFKFSLAR